MNFNSHIQKLGYCDILKEPEEHNILVGNSQDLWLVFLEYFLGKLLPGWFFSLGNISTTKYMFPGNNTCVHIAVFHILHLQRGGVVHPVKNIHEILIQSRD